MSESPLGASQSGYAQVHHGQLFFQKFGSGEPIVVLHGGPGLDHTCLLPQMLELAKDYQVIFYDQRGSGKSLETDIDSKYITIDQFAQDLEELRSALGLNKFILLGHSWGGILAMDYATKHPGNLSCLILLSSGPADYKGNQDSINEYKKRTEPIKNKIKALFNYEDFKRLNARAISRLYKDVFSVYFYNPKKTEHLNFSMSERSAQSGFKVMGEMAKIFQENPSFTLFPALEKLKVPTLIIHGTQDVILAYTAQEIKDAIPDSHIVYLENCGHFPYIEKPQELFSAIRLFLRSSR